MFETIIAALLPIVITLCLGFFAGWHKDFNAEQGSVLNRMVMLYALPLTLFAGMLGLKKSVLLEQGPMALLLLIGMVGGYILILVISRFIFRRDIKTAALQALAIAGPAVPFVGVPVLGFLYGELSTVPIALCSIIMNLFQVPVTLFILSQGQGDDSGMKGILDNLKKTVKEPVVWAPILAFVLLLVDVYIPNDIRSSLLLLGKATGGVALFASGVILFSYRVVFNKSVCISVIAKNIVVPIVMLLIGLAFGMEKSTLTISVISLAIPTASICVILAVQYNTAQQEMASTLFFSTILSVITMGALLMYLH